MILLRRYETKIVKKQPTLEASEDFPQGKSTSNKLCTVLYIVFFYLNIHINPIAIRIKGKRKTI